MQNDHKDDGVDGDDRKGEYRDNPADFAASSDLARSGTPGHYDGGGPEDSDPLVAARGEQTWQGGGGADPSGSSPPEGAANDETTDVGGIAASDANLGASLPDAAGELDPATRDASRGAGGATSDAALDRSIDPGKRTDRDG